MSEMLRKCQHSRYGNATTL